MARKKREISGYLKTYFQTKKKIKKMYANVKAMAYMKK